MNIARSLREPDESHPLWRAILAWPTNPGLALLRAMEAAAISTVCYETPCLDVGCGSGSFATVLPVCADLGLDSNVSRCESASGLGCFKAVVCGDISNLPFRSDQFATVIANSVFEHLNSWVGAARESLRVLKKDGLLILTSPTQWTRKNLFFGNPDLYITADAADAYGEYFDHRWEHVAYASVEELLMNAAIVGLEVLDVWTYNVSDVSEIVDLLLNMRIQYVEWSRSAPVAESMIWPRILFSALYPYFEAGVRREPQGGSVLLVARKP